MGHRILNLHVGGNCIVHFPGSPFDQRVARIMGIYLDTNYGTMYTIEAIGLPALIRISLQKQFLEPVKRETTWPKM